MTTDEKIDEVLKVVHEQGERSEARDDELLRLIREQGEKNEARFSRLEANDEELLSLIREERVLNNSRFTQLSTGLMDVRKEVGQVKVEMAKMSVDLNTKIDRTYDALSQDIHAFAGDLHSYPSNPSSPQPPPFLKSP